MRIKNNDLLAIAEAYEDIITSGKLFLFGSRMDDDKKGGDLDLYIDYDKETDFEALYVKVKKFRKTLEAKLPFKKIDTVFTYPGRIERNIDKEGRGGILLGVF
jgi:uncharacterized protein